MEIEKMRDEMRDIEKSKKKSPTNTYRTDRRWHYRSDNWRTRRGTHRWYIWWSVRLYCGYTGREERRVLKRWT